MILTGLLGYPISHSLSPKLHKNWFAQFEVAGDYEPFEVASEARFYAIVAKLRSNPEFAGANITIPYKRAALEIPEVAIDELACKAGGANVLYRRDGLWRLGNTDVSGISYTLTSCFSDVVSAPFRCIVLGSGGTAGAVAAALELTFCRELIVVSRNPARAQTAWSRLKLALPVSFCSESELPAARDGLPVLIVNTIPLGHSNEENLVALKVIFHYKDKGLVCYFDVIYTETPAVVFAKENGIPAVDGKRMLEMQAAQCFELWTGHRPPIMEEDCLRRR